MTLQEAATKLLRSLKRAGEEHGLPNSFGFAELHVHYGGPPPLLGGRAARLYPDLLKEAGFEVDDARKCLTSVS